MISLIFKYQVRICIDIANTLNREANLGNEEKEALPNVLYVLFLYILLPFEIFSSFICEEVLNMINRERKWHCWYENFRRFKPHLLLRLFKALVIHRTACTTNVFKAFVWKHICLVVFPKVLINRLQLKL